MTTLQGSSSGGSGFLVLARTAPTDSKTAVVDLSDRVLSFAYEDSEAKNDKLKLTIENFDLRNLDDPLLAKGGKIDVSWGYPGRLSPKRTFTLTSVKGSTVLNVEGQDDAVNMGKVQKVRHFEKVKRSDVAAAIAREHGYASSAIFVEDTEIVLEQVTQARMTDAQLLADMARREGFIWYVDYQGFHFKQRPTGAAPRARFEYYTGNNVLKFNIEEDNATGKQGGFVAAGIDPKTKKPIKATADNVNTKRDALAPVAGLTPGVDTKGSKTDSVLRVDISKRTGKAVATETTRTTSAGSAVMPTTAKTQEEAKRAVDGAFKKASLEAVKLTLDTRGDPYMVAKAVIEVTGIGKRFSGNYYVTDVNHKGAPNGDYTMTLKCKRDGNSASGVGGSGAAAAKDAGAIPTKAPVNNAAAATEEKLVLVTKIDPRTGQATASYKRGDAK